MTVDSASFVPLDTPLGPWVMRVIIKGLNFETRSAPIVAKVGELDVDLIQVAPDGTIVSGLIAEVPTPGSRLKIGYMNDAELIDTTVTFPGQ